MSNIEPVRVLRYGTVEKKLNWKKQFLHMIILQLMEIHYVYNTYPETVENLLIRDKYIKKEGD